MAKKFVDLSKQLIDNIGGKDNVSSITHCATRLRFVLKDKSIVKENEVEKISGIIGTQWLGEQYQLIVGADVDEIYNVICSMYNFEKVGAIDEVLDSDLKDKKGIKAIGNKILAYMSPTMTGVIPIMIAACMCKMFASILGPGMLNVIADTSDIYLVLNMMYNAFFYYMPVFLGYSAAKSLNINPLYGLFCGAIIIVPDFIGLVGVRESINVFGVPAQVSSYAQSFLPVIIGVWVMSYIIKLLNKIVPTVLKQIIVPFLTIVAMTIIMLCVCAPLGTWIGNAIGNFFIMFSEANVVVRIIGTVLLAILMPYMVLGGMHGALLNFAIMTWATNGFETFVLPIMTSYNFAVFGMALGALLKVKKSETKTTVTGYFLSGILGSVTEPILFGVTVKYKGALKVLTLSSIVYGIYAAIFQPFYYIMSSATVFTFFVPYTTGTTANLVNGIILTLIAFFVTAIASYLFIDYGED